MGSVNGSPQQDWEREAPFQSSMVQVNRSLAYSLLGSPLSRKLSRISVLQILVVPMGIGPASIPPGEICSLFRIGRCVAWLYFHHDCMGVSVKNEVSQEGNSEVPFAG